MKATAMPPPPIVGSATLAIWRVCVLDLIIIIIFSSQQHTHSLTHDGPERLRHKCHQTRPTNPRCKHTLRPLSDVQETLTMTIIPNSHSRANIPVSLSFLHQTLRFSSLFQTFFECLAHDHFAEPTNLAHTQPTVAYRVVIVLRLRRFFSLLFHIKKNCSISIGIPNYLLAD